MIKVGLTGKRFSGKKKILKDFYDIGIPIFDADIVVKFILSYDWNTLGALNKKIGAEYFKSNSELDIPKISKDSKFESILKFIEPNVFKAYKKFNDKNYKSIYTIFKSSVLCEMCWSNKMDYSISVEAPFEIRLMRKSQSKNPTDRSMKLLSTDEYRKANFDWMIANHSHYDTMHQVEKIDQKIIDIFLKNEHLKIKSI
jgi:dephospho-CoA kinase